MKEAHDDGPADTWYIASRTRHAPRWRALREKGIDVIATWIDEAGAGETGDWEDLWTRCQTEAQRAHTFVLYAEEGETLRGAFLDLGFRLSVGLPAWAVAPDSVLRSVAKHPLVVPAEGYVLGCIRRICEEVSVAE